MMSIQKIEGSGADFLKDLEVLTDNIKNLKSHSIRVFPIG